MHNPLSARVIVASLSVAAVAAGCATPEPTDSSVVRTDSAGVRIVASGGPDKDLPWTFERVSVMRDSAGEPWIFRALPASHVITDRGSRTYVLTSDGPSVQRFGPEGDHERSLGRKGGAPGEMQFPIALGSQADSIFVHDVGREVLVRWGSDLNAINDLRLDGALLQASGIAFRTGGLWVAKRAYDGSIFTLDLLGDTLGTAPLHRIVQPAPKPVKMCSGSIMMPPMFSPQLRWSASGPRLVVNAQPEYVVLMYEGARLIASVRRPLPMRAPTAADAELEMPDGFRVQFGSGPLCVLTASEALEQMGSAPLLPHVAEVKLLSDGTIWVERTPQGEARTLDVFAADGSYAGTVRGMELPVGLLPNGDLLVPVEDSLSGGFHLARMKVSR